VSEGRPNTNRLHRSRARLSFGKRKSEAANEVASKKNRLEEHKGDLRFYVPNIPKYDFRFDRKFGLLAAEI
jgi:hypothetical protein